jgi:hypothetical protein
LGGDLVDLADDALCLLLSLHSCMLVGDIPDARLIVVAVGAGYIGLKSRHDDLQLRILDASNKQVLFIFFLKELAFVG